MNDASIQVRALTPADIAVWDALAHQSSDDVVKELLSDPSIFYDGFDTYMEAKVRQGEAFMAVDPGTDRCKGIVAFSRKHNRITFLGAVDRDDLAQVGSRLLVYAMGQLDPSRPIQSTVLQSTHPLIAEEMRLYTAHGFEPGGETVEAGVNATIMVRSAISTDR